MARVDLKVNRSWFAVTCEDGEESRLRRLAALFEEKLQEILAATGDELDEPRALFMAGLLLADALEEATAEKRPGGMQEIDPLLESRIGALADRVERVAERLAGELSSRADLAEQAGRG